MAFLEASYDNNYWFPLPTPTAGNYSPTYTHLEKSYRDSRGYLHRDITRENLAKVVCGWSKLNSDEIRLLQTLYGVPYFYLKFTDNYGDRVIKKVYSGPIDAKTQLADKNTYLLVKRTDIQANYIEY